MHSNKLFLSLGSGILYAAFLHGAPFLHPLFVLPLIFLPSVFYFSGILAGVRGLFISLLPTLFMSIFTNETVYTFFSFFIITILPVFLSTLAIEKRNTEILKKTTDPQWGFPRIITFITFTQIVLLSCAFCIPSFLDNITQSIANLPPTTQAVIKNNNALPQVIFAGSISYALFHMFCFFIGRHAVQKIEKTERSCHPKDNTYDLWIDIPVWLFLILYALTNYFDTRIETQMVLYSFLVLSTIPSFLLGTVAFKHIGRYYKFSDKTLKIMMVLFFFLVQPLLLIVLLGVMESCCNVSRQFRRT